MMETFTRMAATISSAVESRLFSEYGAIFATRAVPPPKILFRDADQVASFQSSLETESAMMGDHPIELQREAMGALLKAAACMKEAGKAITARAEDAGRRSYEDTVRLWTRNVTRGLDHWREEGRIAASSVQEIIALAPADQVSVILALEGEEQIYFGTFFDKSILYSVAAPGASQHLALLAFDVAEFESSEVERALAHFGWHRTVANDFPHFTYLGYEEEELPRIGLKKIARSYKDRDYFFWIPDLHGF